MISLGKIASILMRPVRSLVPSKGKRERQDQPVMQARFQEASQDKAPKRSLKERLFSTPEKTFAKTLKAQDEGDHDNVQHASTQYKLAQMYEKGIGTEKDQQKAFILYQKAAEGGNSQAQYDLATLHQKKGQEGAAAYYLKLAAEDGHPQAQCDVVSLMCLEKAHPEQAMKYHKQSAESGNAEAQYKYALSSFVKDGNSQVGIKYATLSAKQGYPEALTAMGVWHEKGEHTFPKNDAKALKYYAKAAKQGHEEAQFKYDILKMGKKEEKRLNVERKEEEKQTQKKEKSYKKALIQLRKIREKNIKNGDKTALYSLAEMHRKGKGGKQDYDKALKLYEEGANTEDSSHRIECINAAGKMYLEGQGEKENARNIPKAMTYFKMGKDLGNIDSIKMLASLALESNDLPLARECYKEGSKQGVISSKLSYASMLRKGEGGEKEPEEAIKIFKKALNYHLIPPTKYAEAVVALGEMYQNGEGCKINLQEAELFFRTGLLSSPENVACKEGLEKCTEALDKEKKKNSPH